jgi:hypothetical protein
MAAGGDDQRSLFPMSEPCGNCGAPDEELTEVRRLWLFPTVTRDPDVERWCASCRTLYPHEEPA